MNVTLRRLLGVGALCAALSLAGLAPAAAHEERESVFPPGTGTVPTYRPMDSGAPRLVVCKKESGRLIAKMNDPVLKAKNQQLLGECRFRHIQAAVDAVTTRGTNIYVLPGVYREEPSWNPPCAQGYDGGVVDYDLIVSCGEVINLVTVAGDDPRDPDHACDNALCDLQIEGTGQRMEDVVLRGGFTADGDWIKHNGIKADRADGFYLRNLTAELFRENAIYVHETDGYAIDRVNARHNDLYGILSFASDHGLMKDCDTSYNGDSGVYPGSASDVNRDSTQTGPLQRFAVEVTGCRSHHNALGFSGTAGNSVYFHDNDFHDNGAGYVTDSFVGGHPGMPQDHAWLTNNRIYSNNSNYYEQFVHSGICSRKPAERGYGKGTVCPAFPVPVGTGVLIAGGNYNFVQGNQIWDNWRNGVMLFWVPGAVRGDYQPEAQYDTSNGNHFRDNAMGFAPNGLKQPNGTDFWWDDQGLGNCWQGNTSSRGAVTHNATLALPDCASGGSTSPAGNPAKSAANAPCATYNREDNPDPVGCDWFDTPQRPADREDETATAAGAAGPQLPAGLAGAAGSGATLPALAGALMVGTALALRRRLSVA